MRITRERIDRKTFANAAAFNGQRLEPSNGVPLDGVLYSIILFLRGVLTIADATGAALVQDSVKRLIREITMRIKMKGISQAGEGIVQLSPRLGAGIDLYRVNQAAGRAGAFTEPGIGVAAQPVNLQLEIPFFDPFTEGGLRSALRGDAIEDLELSFLTGSADGGAATAGTGDLVTGTPATFSATFAGSLDVILTRAVDLTPDEMRLVGRGLLLLDSRQWREQIATSVLDAPLELPTGGRYLAMFLRALDAGVRTDARITDLALRLGGATMISGRDRFDVIQSRGVADFKGIDEDDIKTGHIEIGFAPNKKIVESFRTRAQRLELLASSDATWSSTADDLIATTVRYAPFAPGVVGAAAAQKRARGKA